MNKKAIALLIISILLISSVVGYFLLKEEPVEVEEPIDEEPKQIKPLPSKIRVDSNAEYDWTFSIQKNNYTLFWTEKKYYNYENNQQIRSGNYTIKIWAYGKILTFNATITEEYKVVNNTQTPIRHNNNIFIGNDRITGCGINYSIPKFNKLIINKWTYKSNGNTHFIFDTGNNTYVETTQYKYNSYEVGKNYTFYEYQIRKESLI